MASTRRAGFSPFTVPAVAGTIQSRSGKPGVQWHQRVVEAEQLSLSALGLDRLSEHQ
jgi:hypothetical protein